MKRKKSFSFLGIGLVLMFALFALPSFSKGMNLGETMSEEDRGVMRLSVDEGNYEMWKSIREENMERKSNSLDEERFEEIRNRRAERLEFRNKIHDARESGDWDEVNNLRDEFGVGRGHRNNNMYEGDCPNR